MDTGLLISFLQESLFLIVVVGGLLMYAMIRSLQSLINLILGLYLALLISLQFPYYQHINAGNTSTLTIAVFLFFALVSTVLFHRLMPRDEVESTFEYFWKKLLLALGGAVLIMIFSYHALPVTDLFTPGTPIQYLFASEERFFWWLLVPLVLLYFL